MDFLSYLPTLNLALVAVLIGTALVVTHLFGLLAPDLCMTVARDFPRSRIWASVLLSISTVWVVGMTATMDLGEFSPMREKIIIATVAGAFLLWKFVPDFLSSRSVGFLLLLLAQPVLEATFLQNGLLHLALVLLAYGWVLAGLFLVGMPYLHRDMIGWICGKKSRWNLACWLGVIFGTLLLTDGARLEIFH